MLFSLIKGIMSLFYDRMGIKWSGGGEGGGEGGGREGGEGGGGEGGEGGEGVDTDG